LTVKRLLFTAVAAAAVTLGAAPAQAAVSCGAPGIDTILRTAHTRIFEVNGGDVFACQGVGGRAVLLPVFQFGPPGSVAVRGHFVAYFSGIAQSPEGKVPPPVADSSLRRHGRRVTWLHDHTRRTARL